jgi:hypothetical protein
MWGLGGRPEAGHPQPSSQMYGTASMFKKGGTSTKDPQTHYQRETEKEGEGVNNTEALQI